MARTMNNKQTKNGVNTLSPYEKEKEEKWSKLIANVSEELNKKYYLAIIKLALIKLDLETQLENY